MSDALTITKGNARSSGYERNAHDWYVEPRYAVEALLRVEQFNGLILDPACGSGNIPKVCRENGADAIGSDIVDRGFGEVCDFLQTTHINAQHVITNPPFNLAVEFTLHALKTTRGKVCILQRTTWLEGDGRYQRLFSLGKLARIWQFRRRISMPPGGSTLKASGGSVAFAWYVFAQSYCGLPTLGWVP